MDPDVVDFKLVKHICIIRLTLIHSQVCPLRGTKRFPGTHRSA